MIGAGRLDTRCAFQSLTNVSDGGGGYTTTWTTQFTVWGSLLFPSIRTKNEAIASGTVQSITGAILTIRDYSSTTRLITNEWRVTARGNVWNIRSFEPQVDGFIRLMIERGVPDSGAGDVVAVAAAASNALLESGDALLLESGDNILLEA